MELFDSKQICLIILLGIILLLSKAMIVENFENNKTAANNQPVTNQTKTKTKTKTNRVTNRVTDVDLRAKVNRPNPPSKVGPCPSHCASDKDCNIVFGDGQNKCMEGRCSCVKGSGTFCHLRPNYYKKLSEMTPSQIIKFKKKGKLEKMTIQDYKNWLSLFKYDYDNLPRQHHQNFQRLQQGQVIYDIPLEDPVEEFFSSDAAVRDRVCMDIPNAEIDSPLNWKINSTLTNAGIMNVRGETERPLNWSRYFKQAELSKTKMNRQDKNVQVKDWFMNNVNWLYYDIDRNAAWKEPNLNRFMNIVADARHVPEANFKPQKLLVEKSNGKPRGAEPRLEVKPTSSAEKIDSAPFKFMGA